MNLSGDEDCSRCKQGVESFAVYLGQPSVSKTTVDLLKGQAYCGQVCSLHSFAKDITRPRNDVYSKEITARIVGCVLKSFVLDLVQITM